MTCRKRVLASFLCGFYIMANVLTSYVTAYATAIPAAYSAWEVLQLILLSMGVTVEVTASDFAQDVVSDITGTFEMWMKQNGFDDAEQTRKDLEMIIETGKEGIVNISQNVWEKLCEWVGAAIGAGALLQDGTFEEVAGLIEGENSVDVEKFKGRLQECINIGNVYILLAIENGYALIQQRPNENRKDAVVDLPVEYGEQFTYGGTGNVWARCFLENGMFSANRVSGTYRNLGYAILAFSNGMYALAESVPDVLFPELDLKSDICGIPGINVDELLETGAYDVITSGRTWDGTDVAGDVILTFPEELGKDVIFQDLIDDVIAGDIPYTDALADVGAIPVDKTKDETLVGGLSVGDAIIDVGIENAPSIEDTKEETNSDGTTTQTSIPMTFDLKKLFPFCIPFDIIDFISVLSAKPVAPRIQYPLKYPTAHGMATYEIDIDLSVFDEVAKLLRTMETIVFIVGLAGITRNHMIRG